MPLNLYLIDGQDEFLKKEELKKIENELFSSPLQRDFNRSIFDAKEVEAKEIIELTKVLPWQVSHRLIIVRNIEYFKPTQQTALVSYLKHPSCHTILVLTSGKIDKRSQFYRTICKLGKVIQISRGRVNNVFELTAAVSRKDEKKALNILDALLRQGKKVYEIIGLLFWQIDRLKKGKELLEKKGKQSLMSELRVFPSQINDFIDSVNRFSFSELKRNIGLLTEADLQIKTAITKPEMILEILVLKLCHAPLDKL